MCRASPHAAALLAAVLSCLAHPSIAAINVPGDAPSLQAALERLAAGEAGPIILAPGRYDTGRLIAPYVPEGNMVGVSIQGSGPETCRIKSLALECANVLLSEVTVEDLRLRPWHRSSSVVDCRFPGAVYSDTHSWAINFERCWFMNADVTCAVSAEDPTGFLACTFINSRVTGYAPFPPAFHQCTITSTDIVGGSEARPVRFFDCTFHGSTLNGEKIKTGAR